MTCHLRIRCILSRTSCRSFARNGSRYSIPSGYTILLYRFRCSTEALKGHSSQGSRIRLGRHICMILSRSLFLGCVRTVEKSKIIIKSMCTFLNQSGCHSEEKEGRIGSADFMRIRQHTSSSVEIATPWFDMIFILLKPNILQSPLVTGVTASFVKMKEGKWK